MLEAILWYLALPFLAIATHVVIFAAWGFTKEKIEELNKKKAQ